MFDETVYTKNKSGQLRFIRIFTEGKFLNQHSGLVDGKINMQKPIECRSKNVGRKNETTPEEQAIMEAKSKLKSKLKSGYYKKVEDMPETCKILPMLAKDYYKEIEKKSFIEKFKLNEDSIIFTQPKLDGMRCLIYIDKGKIKLISREGKDVVETSNNSIKHIIENFNIDEKMEEESLILDGELYSHSLNFQQIISAIKKFSENTLLIKYNVYDCFSLKNPDLIFSERLSIIKSLKIYNDTIKLLNTSVIKFHNDIEKTIENKLQNTIKDNYEGLIIRLNNEKYVPKSRSKSLLKCKKFLDDAYEIVDIIPEEKRPLQGKVRCFCKKTKKEFNCGMRFSHDERKEFLENRNNYIGKKGEIRFFEYTNSGIPRHPVCVGIRLDK